MTESRSKYTIKRHKPELPQEQKLLVENLQTKVLRVVDEIIVAIRQRHPRSTTTAVVSWDHGGPHDAEIRARRKDIADVIKRGVEEGFCFQNDNNIKLTGLFNDAQRKIATLRKMNEEKKCAFCCQSQGTAGGTAGREDVTREEGAATEKATVEGGGSGSSTVADVPNPSSNVVQDDAAPPAPAPPGKGGAKDVFEKSKSSSSSGVRNVIEGTESRKEKKNLTASLPCGGFKCPTWNILLSQEGEDEHNLGEQMAREGMRLLSRLTDDNNNNVPSVPDIATNSRRKTSKCAIIAPAVTPNTFYMVGGPKEAGE